MLHPSLGGFVSAKYFTGVARGSDARIARWAAGYSEEGLLARVSSGNYLQTFRDNVSSRVKRS
jgi:hypothetical protein